MKPVKTAVSPVYRRLILAAIFLTALILLVWIFPLIGDLVVVVIISLVLTYVLKPGVDYLVRIGLSDTQSIMVHFGVAFAVMLLALRYLIPLIIEEAGMLSANLDRVDLAGVHEDIVRWLDSKSPGLAPMLGLESGQAELIVDKVRSLLSGFLKQSVSLAAGAFNMLALAIVVPFLTFFFLKDGDRAVKGWIARVPNRYFEMALSLSYRIDKQLGAYIRSVLLESLIVALLTWAALGIMGLKFSIVLGLVNGLLNLIPFFGPLIAYLPIGLVVLLTYNPPGWGLLWMVIILVAVQVIDNILLKPILISRSVNVHPGIVLLAVLIGGRLAGPVGMFVAVPVYAVIQVIVVDLYTHLVKYKII